MRLGGEGSTGPEAWGDTEIVLPDGVWCDELTGGAQPAGRRRVAELLGRFPVALLARERPAA